MRCCLPPLVEIPTEEYYCFDCSEKGATEQLEEYFDQCHSDRALFTNSYEYVQHLLEVRTQEELGSEREVLFPKSELTRLSQLHHDAIIGGGRFAANYRKGAAFSQSFSKPSKPLKPDFLVGKAVQLYCPMGNQYHNGRIVDLRPATHCRKFWASEVDDMEFLVHFPAGSDFRKTSYNEWIILEEHAMAVSTSLIWGQASNKKGILGWRPAWTWLRTSLELHPVRSELSEAHGQIHFIDAEPLGTKEQDQSWALCKFLADQQHALLLLREEAIDYFSPLLAQQRHHRHLQQVGMPTAKKGSDVLDRAKLELSVGAANAEWKEQQRVKEWQKLPLDNPYHARAMKLRHEADMGPIRLEKPDGIEKVLSPAMEVKGLDRLYVLEQFFGVGGKDRLSKDMLAAEDDYTFEIVSPSPEVMKQLRDQQKQVG